MQSQSPKPRRTISLTGRIAGAHQQSSQLSSNAKKVRRSSVDEGSPDWPTSEDIAVGNTVTVLDPDSRLCELVGEVGELQVVVPKHPPSSIMSKPAADFHELQEPQGYEICKVHLPTAAELPVFPKVLRDHLLLAALATLRLHFYPCVLLRQRVIARNRATALRQPTATPVSPDLMETISLFRGWPQEALKVVAASLKFTQYDQREVIVHEKEPSRVMYFVTTGAVKHIVRVKGRFDKKLSGKNVAQSNLLVAPCSFGSQNLLTSEPWGHAVRSTTKCDVFTITRQDFNAAMALVPTETKTETIHSAFERRNELMGTNFPLEVDDIRKHNIFSRVSTEFAKEIIDRLESCAVPEDFALVREGEPSVAMYFVRRGQLFVKKKVDGVETTVETVTAPSLHGDTPLVYNSVNTFTVKTKTDCDIYNLSKHNFELLCRQYTSDVDAMLDAAREQRNAELKSNYLKYRRVLHDMPLLNTLIQPYHLRDFLGLVQPKSYRPMSCICNTSDYCDRVIVLTKGTIVLGRSSGLDGQLDANGHPSGLHHMAKWESIGWTCCVPHRWALPAMTTSSTVEVLEIPMVDLMLFLHERNLLDKVTRATKMLMFPRAFPPQEVAALKQSLPPHVIVYPTSRSFTVNLSEMGFCHVHMSALVEAERTERERKESTDTPQSFKELSRGVWIPTSRRIRGFTTSKN